ncbi:MBL fold metallo-hydrolase RNA specificity domain-containing protein [Oceanidesulfovibrio marinus]|uniref:MBL fold metallo-hydrolase n=1 Tax=Oceanidesulfovibrio marinus TaxID=370038 RepID=A0A6P1ZHB3_9BACT|nr:MBL fold metallo-hydrolase [Oceanidesulfovibrio marinus]QJT07546.1 MBL fold metallo-hydrolase [Oceanidesulfovibrio marinus]TVM34540.1 MBL fold metallo-hydrolase [Oceanidesulfovibrio marinus]
MKIKFLGAAQTVSGSCHLIETMGRRFAVDCGMHQGNKEIDERNEAVDLYDPKNIDFFLITHAHIDHSGLLPKMVKEGFTGKIYATEPTRDLLEIMLLDSAHIQEMEAEWESRKKRRRGNTPVEPLYTQDDAMKAMELFEVVEYNTLFEPVEGVKVVYCDAGHILGSAFVEMTVIEKNGGDNGEDTHYHLLFSGDLGRPNQLIIRDPEQPSEDRPVDYLFIESTYGDRDHKDQRKSRQELAEAIEYSYKRGEKVIIPAFAVERSQEMIYSLYLLDQEGKLPRDMPVFLDSPMAIRATEVFRKHPSFFDEDAKKIMEQGHDPLTLPQFQYTLKTQESQALNTMKGPAVIISASGMCNAGRIKHHLRHNLWRPGASVVFVGYQARGTPGRKIVDGAKSIRIFGEDIAVAAKIFTIGGFSAHAGQSQILDWVDSFDQKGMEVFLVHGELEKQEILAKLMRERFQLKVRIPAYLEDVILKPGRAMDVIGHPEVAYPSVDWNYVLGEAEAKLTELRSRLTEVEAKPWIDQSELRDRVLDTTNELSKIVSDL